MDNFVIKKRKIDENKNDKTAQGEEPPKVLSRSSQDRAIHEPITLKILDYWTETQWYEKLETYKWLTVKETGLGCSICSSLNDLGTSKTQGLKLVNEWVNCTVREYGDTKEKKQQSIRKKISSHKVSTAHIEASKIVSLSKDKCIETLIAQTGNQHFENTHRIFRTVYYLAKKNRPFTDLPDLIDLQKANGIKMGRILQSDHSASDITLHIANEMRQKLVNYILENDLKIGFLIDESTTISKKSTLSICLRVKLPETTEVSSLFFDLIELENTTARTIYEMFLQFLYCRGFNDNFLTRNWISFACDGASNMLGKKSGVARLLINKFPNLIVWHCSNHRLELAVNLIVNQISPICHMKKFFDKLYAIYNASPKNRRELEKIAQELCVKVNSIGRILDTRWVSSNARSVLAVWNSYSALYKHFDEASIDVNRTKKDREIYIELKLKLSDTNFVHNMGLMLDALLELEHLSQKLQSKNMTLPEAHRLIVLKYRVFQSMPNNPGEYYDMVLQAIERQKFQSVELKTDNNIAKIDIKTFFEKLNENLSSRMFTTRAAHMSKHNNEDCELNREKYMDLVNSLEIFDYTKWPEDKIATFGDKEIRKLANTFNVCPHTSVQGFREFFMNGSDKNSKTLPKDLQPLKVAIDTIIISTAECERSFSSMNLILSDIRSTLKATTTSSLMFLKMVGPSVEMFNPTDYTQSWLKKGRRDADFKNCSQRSTTKNKEEQLWKLF